MRNNFSAVFGARPDRLCLELGDLRNGQRQFSTGLHALRLVRHPYMGSQAEHILRFWCRVLFYGAQQSQLLILGDFH